MASLFFASLSAIARLASPRLPVPRLPSAVARNSRLLCAATTNNNPNFSPQRGRALVDAVKAAAPIAEVVSEHGVDVMRLGSTTKARCPFHGGGTERTPSMALNEEAGTYYCFACGASGDQLSFMQEHEGLSFREAVEVLAERYDVPLTADFGRGGGGGGAASKADDKRSRALLAHQLAAEFYSSRLRTADAAPCATLLRGRYGARASALANRFGLGYAPGGAGAAELTEHLRAAGLTDDELVAAGLSRPRYGQKGGPIVDRFAGRLMIPIWDRKGEVVAFGARILDGAAAASAGSFEEAKYINSAESLVFKKRETLYGAHLARDAARAAGEVVVVEGYLDAIALHAAGVANAVACLGTALTQTQLLAAAALSPAGRVVLNLDGDEAGERVVANLVKLGATRDLAAAGIDVRVAGMADAAAALDSLANLARGATMRPNPNRPNPNRPNPNRPNPNREGRP